MKSRGVTLVELLITTSIIAIISLAASYAYGNLQTSSQINEVSSQLVQSLRATRLRAVAGQGNTNHGVYIDRSGSAIELITYRGGSYSTRDSDYDLTYTFDEAVEIIPGGFTVVGSNIDINFSGSRGLPNNYGSLIINHLAAGQAEVILNSLGHAEQN